MRPGRDLLSTYLCVADDRLVDSLRSGETYPAEWRVESTPDAALNVARSGAEFELVLIDGGIVKNGSAVALVESFRAIRPAPILFLEDDPAADRLDIQRGLVSHLRVYNRTSPPQVIRHAIRRMVRTAALDSADRDGASRHTRIPVPSISQQARLVSEVFGRLGLDPVENIETIVRQAANVVGGVASLYNRLDREDNSLVTWADHQLPPDADRRDTPTGHICYEATIKGGDKPVVIEEIDDTDYVRTDENVARYGLHAYIGFPVMVNGETIGSLCVVDTIPRRFSDPDIDAIEILAHAIEHEERQIRVRENHRLAVQEREITVREVQHRIKNDLAIVKATLDVRAAATPDASIRTPLVQAATQIDVMLRVYDRLTVANAAGTVEIASFVRDLTKDLQRAIVPTGIAMDIDVEPLKVSGRLAIAIGTIINELVTNSVKHAFTGHSGSCCLVTIRRFAGTAVQVVVRDNGSGFPPAILEGDTHGFGLTATRALSDQYHGSVTLQNDDGAVVSVVLNFDA